MVKNVDLNNVKEKIALAKKTVEGEEEPIKTAAFQVIFSKLLEGDYASQSDRGNTPKHSQKEKEIPQLITEIGKTVLDKIDVNKLQYLKSLKSVHDQSLALLAHVSKNVREYPSLTSDEMKEVLSEKFGLTTITVNNISMSLKNVTGKYVTRKEITVKTTKSKIKKYRYEILQKGMEYIQKKIAETQKPVK